MKNQGAWTLVPSNKNNRIKVFVPSSNNLKKRYLPHIDLPGYYQFVTFRTNDSVDDYLKKIRTEKISNREKEYKIDKYIDISSKGCYLNGKILEYLKNFLKEQDGKIYLLAAFTVMPNHIHILFKQQDELKKIMKILKGNTAFQINKMLNKKGNFWEKNYYDTLIRNQKHFDKVYEYIKFNAKKAGLSDIKDRFYGIFD